MTISHICPRNSLTMPSSGTMGINISAPRVITIKPAVKILRLPRSLSSAKRKTPSVMPSDITGKSRFAVWVIRSAVP